LRQMGPPTKRAVFTVRKRREHAKAKSTVILSPQRRKRKKNETSTQNKFLRKYISVLSLWVGLCRASSPEGVLKGEGHVRDKK